MRIIVIAVLLSAHHIALSQFKFYELGCQQYKAGNYDEAIRLFSEFMLKPAHDKALEVEVHYWRGLALYKKENYKKAIDDFEEAILLNHPNRGNVYWFLAKSSDKLGFYNDAVEYYSNALRELPDKEAQAKLFYERSIVYTTLGKTSLAYEDLQAGNKIHPGNAEIKKELDRLISAGVSITHQAEEKTVGNDTSQKKGTIAEPHTSASDPGLAEYYNDEKRYALVIGNAAYSKKIGELKNPVNDATDIAAELEASNFNVQLLLNGTYGQIRAALLKFKERIDAGEREKTVALFYYAGHGLQHDGENYIVPVDADIEYEDDIPRYCFPIQRMVLTNMEVSNSRMNIIILDACRNNPFPSVSRSIGNNGLAEMKKGKGAFIAYATAPGSVASDGNGRNGLYTQELLSAMRKPGRTIEQVFKEVRQNVLKLSSNRQNTWDSSNIIGEFHFKF